MSADLHVMIHAWWKEAWHQFKTVGLVFLGMVLLTAGLLMTNLPKATVLWSSCVGTILVTILSLNWQEHRNMQRAKKKSHHRGYTQSQEKFLERALSLDVRRTFEIQEHIFKSPFVASVLQRSLKPDAANILEEQPITSLSAAQMASRNGENNQSRAPHRLSSALAAAR